METIDVFHTVEIKIGNSKIASKKILGESPEAA